MLCVECFRLANLFYSSINLTPELQVTRRKTVTLVSDLVRFLFWSTNQLVSLFA